MGDVYCNNCGHKNPIGSNFCSSCGAVLETDSHDNTTITFHPTSPVDPLDSGEPSEPAEPGEDASVEVAGAPTDLGLLVVKRGQNVGSRFGLSIGVTTAGRHPDSDIFLDDVTVSRRHAEILAGPEGFVVRDVGSLNGTYLNRERIDQAPLTNGDELQIGKFKLVFLQGGAES
ncbi:MAG: FHA domain-containing protein [Acidimicrobiales bacterium]